MTGPPLAAVVRQRRSVVVGAASAVLLYGLLAILSQWSLLVSLVSWDAFSVGQKLTLVGLALSSWLSVHDAVSATVMVLTIVAVGVNVGLFSCLWRRRHRAPRGAAVSAGSVLLSLAGAGCWSCGAAVLTSLIGTAAAATLAGLMPFGGRELGFLALALALAACVQLMKRIVSLPHRTS